MNISYGVPILAPQTTGHPASLPADPPQRRETTRVAAASGSAASNGARAEARNPETESSPPSAMQRKIMEILARQADEIAEREARERDTAEADAAAEQAGERRRAAEDDAERIADARAAERLAEARRAAR